MSTTRRFGGVLRNLQNLRNLRQAGILDILKHQNFTVLERKRPECDSNPVQGRLFDTEARRLNTFNRSKTQFLATTVAADERGDLPMRDGTDEGH